MNLRYFGFKIGKKHVENRISPNHTRCPLNPIEALQTTSRVPKCVCDSPRTLMGGYKAPRKIRIFRHFSQNSFPRHILTRISANPRGPGFPKISPLSSLRGQSEARGTQIRSVSTVWLRRFARKHFKRIIRKTDFS